MAGLNRLAMLKLFSRPQLRVKPQAPVRKLYTDHIYPYPFKYFNETVYPSQYNYRETHLPPPWYRKDYWYAWIFFRAFWTFFFYQLYHDPGVFFGHSHYPDPAKWTDAQLGIPPDEVGPYEKWLEKRGKKEA